MIAQGVAPFELVMPVLFVESLSPDMFASRNYDWRTCRKPLYVVVSLVVVFVLGAISRLCELA